MQVVYMYDLKAFPVNVYKTLMKTVDANFECTHKK